MKFWRGNLATRSPSTLSAKQLHISTLNKVRGSSYFSTGPKSVKLLGPLTFLKFLLYTLRVQGIFYFDTINKSSCPSSRAQLTTGLSRSENDIEFHRICTYTHTGRHYQKIILKSHSAHRAMSFSTTGCRYFITKF